MRKYFIFFSVIFGVTSLFLFSCSNEIQDRELSYKPSDKGVEQVFFPASNTSSFEVEPVVNKVSVVLKREVAANALTVSLNVLDTANVFTVPDLVSFEAGESEVAFDVSFDNLEFFKTYMLKLSFDEELTNPYVEIDGTQEFFLYVLQSDWTTQSQGNFTCEFFGDTWTQDLQYSEILDRYRFANIWFDGYHLEFIWDGQSTIKPFSELFPTGYVHDTYGMIYGEFPSDEERMEYKVEGDEKMIRFNMGWIVPNTGSFGDFLGEFVFTE